MNKLKTLMDLTVEEWKNRNEFVELWVKVDELNQEAINDIKELEDFNPIQGSKFPVIVSGQITNPKEIIAYIKWKFNLTEEDLK